MSQHTNAQACVVGAFLIEELPDASGAAGKIKITSTKSLIEVILSSNNTKISFDSDQTLTALLGEDGLFSLEKSVVGPR